MADDVIDGAPEGAAEQTSAPDLRETIVAAVAKQREEPAEVIEPVEAKPEGEKVETEAERTERLRDKTGKFATEKNAVKPEKVEAEPVKPVIATEQAKPDAPVDPATALRPPTSWSPTAKIAFEKLPPEVQQAVAKREEEVNSGFAKFQEYKPIDRFMQMAKQSGTTLDRALENYVGIENRLRQDFPSGVTELCQRQGIHPVALANAILARHGASPQKDGTGEQQAPQPAAVDPALHQKLSALEQRLSQQEAAREQEITTQVQTELQRFASNPEHKFFENVKADMGFLINSGKASDLKDAYDKACRMNPEIYGLLIKQQNLQPSVKAEVAVQRARAADKTTGGAPSAGFTPTPAIKVGASIRETIQAAVADQRGI